MEVFYERGPLFQQGTNIIYKRANIWTTNQRLVVLFKSNI